jgi:hypothetical protein
MMQLYFLSILFNAVSGYILFDGRESEATSSFALNGGNRSFRLSLGILTALTGFISLIAGRGLPVLGDFIPALCGLASGGALLFDFYRSSATLPTEKAALDAVDIIDKYKKPLGVVSMAAAVLHFLLPNVPLL